MNGEIPVTPIPAWKDQRVKQNVKDISLDEAIWTVNWFKNWKASESNEIPAKLVKYGDLQVTTAQNNLWIMHTQMEWRLTSWRMEQSFSHSSV